MVQSKKRILDFIPTLLSKFFYTNYANGVLDQQMGLILQLNEQYDIDLFLFLEAML